jgi:pyruvate carboxylase
VQGRPGASLPPVNLTDLATALREKHETGEISAHDVLSASMYPKVFDEYRAFVDTYSSFVERLPTRAFLAPLDVDEDVDVELSRGNIVNIKYKAKGELQPDGTREVFFVANGVPRVVEVRDRNIAKDATTRKPQRDRADVSNTGSVPAPMSGEVVEVKAAPGQAVRAGQPLVVLSAMKMETSVAAPCDGTIQHVKVIKGDQLDAGDELLLIRVVESDGEEEVVAV